jgi:alpha-glucosidase
MFADARLVGMATASLLALGLSACGGDDATPEKVSFPEKDWSAESETLLTGPDWYRHAVFYEVYVRSFQDSDGDGIGDLPGLTSRLDYLKGLGIDAIWLMPIMPTPFKDSGYDISDYQAINPDYGTLADFDAFLKAAHDRKMRVIIDWVLNHTSDQHAWFQESRKDKTNPKADWYVWSDTPSAPDNTCGTYNATFGASAWQLDPVRGQYYFPRFYPEQPDLNYGSPEVVNATLDAAKFWLDRGVDGFRCDAIAMLYESATDCGFLDETKDYVRKLRTLLDTYPGRAMVAEPSNLNDAVEYFGSGSDMFQMAFHFGYGYFWGLQFNGKNAKSTAQTFADALSEYPTGAQDALVIGSHDVSRAYAAAQGDETRHRRAALIQLTMRGTPFVYYGEELGLRPGKQQVVDLRDAARTPMLWTSEPKHGFTTGEPWIDFGAEADATNLDVERDDPSSMFEYYRKLLDLRRGREVWGTGQAEILEADTSAVFVARRSDDFMAYVVTVNMTDDPVAASFDAPGIGSKAARVLGQGSLSPKGDSARVSLPAKAAAVFRVK